MLWLREASPQCLGSPHIDLLPVCVSPCLHVASRRTPVVGLRACPNPGRPHHNQLYLQTPYFQIKSRSDIPAGQESWRIPFSPGQWVTPLWLTFLICQIQGLVPVLWGRCHPGMRVYRRTGSSQLAVQTGAGLLLGPCLW